MEEKSKRVKIKLKTPNPLFEKWLLEWHEGEVAAGKLETIYSKALESLRKFPLVLNSGFECIILEHFDKELCLKIANKLAEYETFKCNGIDGFSETNSQESYNNGIKRCSNSPLKKKEDTNLDIAPERSLKNSKDENKIISKKKKRAYIPVKRSAAYGILLALLSKENEPNYLGFLTKSEIIATAQKYSDVSMKKALPGSFYSGWSSMSQLVSKGLVEKYSNPAKFKLTEEGRELALKLKNDHVGFQTDEAHDDLPVLSLESASELIAPHKPKGRKNKKISEENNSKNIPSGSNSLLSSDSQLTGNSQFNHISESTSSQISSGMSSNYQSQEFLAESSPQKNKELKGLSPESQEFETQEMIFLPNNFEIILLVDSYETEGAHARLVQKQIRKIVGISRALRHFCDFAKWTRDILKVHSSFVVFYFRKQRRDEDEILVLLTSSGVKFEVRGLKVGDYLWIARDFIGREMVLPYIIERKRLDDLAHSIKDGRFHEQKFRLKLCGLQNKIYLVENCGYPKSSPFMQNIHQAIMNTMICDKFIVRFTSGLSQTARYLAEQTDILKRIFQDKTLFSCKKKDVPEKIDLTDDIVSLITFADFSLEMEKAKELSAREDFALQLVQLKGMSSDKAWAITEVYPTPRELIKGFLNGEAEKVISELRSGLMKNKVGPQLASVLKTFYTSRDFKG